MLTSYYTIQQGGQTETEVKKSRFICSMERVTSETQAQAFIQQIRKEHWKANHHCSAYLIGDKNEIQRFSDDSEPGGTAGLPMLEVLKKQQLINVCAVVTRYFGGIKLGTGGLIRAYSHSVANATSIIGIVAGRLQQEVFVTIDYSLLGKLQHYLEQENYTIKDSQFTETVTLTVLVEDTDQFIAKITDLLNGQAHFETGTQSYQEKRIN